MRRPGRGGYSACRARQASGSSIGSASAGSGRSLKLEVVELDVVGASRSHQTWLVKHLLSDPPSAKNL
jgi:hypothetical protein